MNADEECEACKLRLRIEYARLYDWGDLTGLLEEESRNEYDRRMKHSQMIVVAILSELRVTLRQLRDIGLRYDGLAESKSDDKAAYPDIDHRRTPPGSSGRARDIAQPNDGSQSNPVVSGHMNPDDVVLPGQSDTAEADADRQEQIRGLFAVPAEPRTARKNTRGLHHVMKLAHGVRKVGTQPKRFRWVLDKPKFAENLAKIKELVTYLHETVGNDQMQALIESSRETQLGMLALTKSVDQMKALLGAVQLALPARPANASTQSLSGTTLNEDVSSNGAHAANESDSSESRFKKSLAKVIEFSIAVNSIDEKAQKDAELGDKDVSSLVLKEYFDGGSRTLAQLGTNQSVWIEWKSYTPISALPFERGPDRTTLKRVALLAALLKVKDRPEELSVPPCLGYYIDTRKKKFGFVFERPVSNPLTSKIQSLFSLLSSGREAVGIQNRITIAMQLSKCLLYFHSVNWLHKGFRSASVLFVAGDGAKVLGRPYITGFEYARQTQGDSTSTGPPVDSEWAFYTHPDYQALMDRKGFRKTYDIYSFGIVLIELAYWQTIDQIMGFDRPKADSQATAGASRTAGSSQTLEVPRGRKTSSRDSPDDIKRIRSRILDPTEGILDRVEDFMGSKYRDAVSACIDPIKAFEMRDDQNQSDPIVSTVLQQEFIRVVIGALVDIVL